MYRIPLALPKNKFTLCLGRFFAPLRMTNLCKPVQTNGGTHPRVGAIHESPAEV